MGMSLGSVGTQGALATGSITNAQITTFPANSIILLTVQDSTYPSNVNISARVQSVSNGAASVIVTATNSTSGTSPGSGSVTLGYMIVNRHN
jgi:hypothetical protein